MHGGVCEKREFYHVQARARQESVDPCDAVAHRSSAGLPFASSTSIRAACFTATGNRHRLEGDEWVVVEEEEEGEGGGGSGCTRRIYVPVPRFLGVLTGTLPGV